MTDRETQFSEDRLEKAEALARHQAQEIESYEHLVDSLEHILFGDVQKRSRDELEDRAAHAICAWNERATG